MMFHKKTTNMKTIKLFSLLLHDITASFIGTCMSLHANTFQIKLISIQTKLAELEASSGGRIGVYAINTANHSIIQYRAQERFPFQSTFKVMGVSAVLKKSMTDPHLLQKKITYNKQDLVFWSPITEQHLAHGMTISELCAATLKFSDNTAINLLMKNLSGPKAVTAFARSIDDKTFRLNSWETELNSNPSELRDSSTPAAMGKSLQQLTLGNVLASSQRNQLVAWMKNNTTGNDRIRAGVPKGWVVADKTGSGGYGITNDIGVIWPPEHAPIVVAIYFVQKNKDAAHRDDVIASVTSMLIREFSKNNERI